MTRKLITGNGAAAWGARLSSVDYIPAFPITPQTEIIETLSDWINKGEMKGRLTMLESEHSMITAAGSAATAGVRVFTATSSQGLLYAMEMIYAISGWRIPLVLVNVSRGLASPITLECDHNDIFAARDSGFIQIHCSTCQEILDSVIMAYRISEHPQIRIPAIVNLDGFYLSFTREPVEIPCQEDVESYLGRYNPMNDRYTPSSAQARGIIVLGGAQYSYFRYQTHLASLRVLDLYEEISAEFMEKFGRDYPLIEEYRMEDAEYCFVMAGSFATKGKAAVDRLRLAGWKTGLIRPRVIRPFPLAGIRKAMERIKGAAVIDQNISFGSGGILYTEVTSSMYGSSNNPVIAGYIGGLGGRDITMDEFAAIAGELKAACIKGEAAAPKLLYTAAELDQIKRLQYIAGIKKAE